MKKITAGIYKITSPTGRIYIGQTWNIYGRWNQYFKNKGEGNQRKLFASFKKYGAKAHKYEIAYILPNDYSQEVINAYEVFIWSQYKEAGFRMLNIREPGSNGKPSEETKQRISEAGKRWYLRMTKEEKEVLFKKRGTAQKGKIISEEARKKLSVSNKGKPSPNKGKKKSPEAIERNKHSHLGKKASEETKIKMSSSKKGKEPNNKGKKCKPCTEERKQKISNANKGRKLTDEQKEKSSKSWFKKGSVPANKGKKFSEETCKKLSESHKGKKLSPESIKKGIETRRKNKTWNKRDS